MKHLVPLLLAAACSPATAAPNAASPDLLGEWRIVALNKLTPIVRRDGRPAVLTFDRNGYGGHAGCNSFGGQGLAHEGRYYGGFTMTTHMACGGPLDAQETGVQRLLASAPRIEWQGPDQVVLVAATQRLELARTGQLASDRPLSPPIPLIGTTWSFSALNGWANKMAGTRLSPVLTMQGDRYILKTPCLVAEGNWTQTRAGAAVLRARRQTVSACDITSRLQSEAWLTAMRGALRYVTGPNGEMLMAGGGRWMIGKLVRRNTA